MLKLLSDCFVVAGPVVMTRNRGETLKDARQSHDDGYGGGDGNGDGGQVILPKLAGHDCVDGAAADDGDVGDENGARKVYER